ncbi:YciI family protein [Phyllobacterium chamaecytisi]|uniref:YciI family protein n=1 Tax=Phyllobacterium chamaecytisi TaxID=2876082 RepID=UPI001CCBE030|nr:YciI family protein [Phyllobacterium sp. KW56]MBZ9603259.1 YciI family protein [Phyllobacterium sp. KW56]
MQFTLIARDDPAAGTLAKRLAARERHMERIYAMKAEGSIIDGGALIDDDGKMIGSVVLCEFPDRVALQAYIDSEIYKVDGVWKDIEVLPFRRVQWR